MKIFKDFEVYIRILKKFGGTYMKIFKNFRVYIKNFRGVHRPCFHGQNDNFVVQVLFSYFMYIPSIYASKIISLIYLLKYRY